MGGERKKKPGRYGGKDVMETGEVTVECIDVAVGLRLIRSLVHDKGLTPDSVIVRGCTT
jgi:hypothetical protein